jgi:quinol monooxygenase YgiN
MRPFFRLAVWLIIFAAIVRSVHAQDGAVYVATYVEVMPTAIVPGATLLKDFRDVSRKQDGNLRFDVLHEIARPNRFAIVEAWKDKAALDAHDKAASTLQFRDKIKPLEDAPTDERVGSELYTAKAKNAARPAAIYVVTHVDVIPPGKDACMAALDAMSIDTANDPGNIGYQVLQQANRSNHFTVVEAWSSKKALDAHAMAAHTRSFREQLAPLAGALYDERFYVALD